MAVFKVYFLLAVLIEFPSHFFMSVSKLSSAIYGAGGLSRHPSSVGEHETSARNTPSLPKRSDTFGGFDNDKEPASPRSKRNYVHKI